MILKINFKNKKNIILIYIKIKNILKNNWYHSYKQHLISTSSDNINSCDYLNIFLSYKHFKKN